PNFRSQILLSTELNMHKNSVCRIHGSLSPYNVALSRALQRGGCSSGLCRSLEVIFPSREHQHCRVALESFREHLCALNTQANAVVLDGGESGLGNATLSAIENDRVRLGRSEEHTSELQSPCNLVCRLLLEKKKKE